MVEVTKGMNVKGDAEKFLRRRGLSANASVYMNYLMKTRQELKMVKQLVCDDTPEVEASISDLIDYVEAEIVFLRNVEEMKRGD